MKEREINRYSQRRITHAHRQGRAPPLYRKGEDLKEEENQVYMIRVENQEEKM